MASLALDMHGSEPVRAHQLRQSMRIVLVGLVALGLECRRGMARLQQHHRQAEGLQFAVQQV
jgi:hypothetical protein